MKECSRFTKVINDRRHLTRCKIQIDWSWFHVIPLTIFIMLLLGNASSLLAQGSSSDSVFLPFVTYGQTGGETGTDLSSAVVNGVEAEPGEFPWQASLSPDASLTNGTHYHICGGSLIHPNWVMTASHCVTNTNEMSIILGAHNIEQSESTYQTFRTVQIIMHPNYNDFTLDNDIALLELDRPAQLNDFVQVIPLATEAQMPSLASPGTELTVSGWGELANGQYPSILQEVSEPVIEQDKCNRMYRGGVTNNMMCVGDGGGGSCYGDSGGPLVTSLSSAPMYQIGIVSWGNRCDWIESIIGSPLTTPGPISTPTATPMPTATPVPTATPMPTAPPVSQGTVSVSNMSGDATASNRGRWNASVTITVVDQSGNNVSGVFVSGGWSSGGSGSCTTDTTGQCTVRKNKLKSSVTSTTYSISAMSKSGYTYNASANSVSSVTISQP